MPRGGKRPNAGRRRGSKNAPKVPMVETQTAATPKPPAPPIENPHNLTAKELLFVTAYTGVALGNASKSFALAGYSGTGSVQRTNACRMLTRDRVAKAIAERLATRVERLAVMGGDEALEHISRFARADIGQVLGPDDPLSKLPDEARLLIKSVRPTKHGRVIELYDALRANELMAKAGGKLREHVNLRVTRGIEDILSEVNEIERQRAQA